MIAAQEVADEAAFLQSFLNLKDFRSVQNSVLPAIQDHFDSINATPNYCVVALPYLLALNPKNSDSYAEPLSA